MIFDIPDQEPIDEEPIDEEYINSWHRQFAWFPVIVEYYPNKESSKRAWLQNVERKPLIYDWTNYLNNLKVYYWEYRVIEKEK